MTYEQFYAKQIAFENQLKNAALSGDSVALDVFVKYKAADYSWAYRRYAYIFKMCDYLGIKNFYDIGCGSWHQAFLLYNHLASNCYTGNYIGIDKDPFETGEAHEVGITKDNYSFEYVNNLHKNIDDSAKPRISYVNSSYPCKLDVCENNIAVAMGVFGPKYSKDEIISIAKAFSHDFERMFINVSTLQYGVNNMLEPSTYYEENCRLWQEAMSCYEFCKISKYNIFATKKHEDIEKLKANYPIVDGKIVIGELGAKI